MPVTDTPPKVQQRFHAMLMALPPADRLKRACAMFSTAKRLAIAGILSEHNGVLDDDTLNRELARRFYRDSLPVLSAWGMRSSERDRSKARAEEFGVDLPLIDAALRLSTEERMRRHFERVRMYQRMQTRTLNERERAALRQARVEEARKQWGSAVPS